MSEMIEHFKTLPNQLTGVRLLLIPILWILAMMGSSYSVGIGLFIAFLTDALDGAIARRFNLVTEFGGKIDSLADNLLIPSALVWILILRGEIITDNPALSVFAILIYLSSISLGIIKFRRFGDLHLYSSKAAGGLLYILTVHSFLADHYLPALLHLAIGMFILSSTETLIVQLTRAQVNNHIGSVILDFLRFSTVL